MSSQNILNDDEIAEPYTFSSKLLPTNHDCLRYVISRTNKVQKTTRDTAIWEMARLVETIWNKADCCPSSRSVIVNKFENNVWKVYCHLLREKCLPGQNENKRSHKKNPAKQKKPTEPIRKSRRITSPPPPLLSIDVQSDETVNLATPATVKVGDDIIDTAATKKTRSTLELDALRTKWNIIGQMLFDVKSEDRLKKCSCFDDTFYQDQKNERKLQMQVTKITTEFVEQEQQRMQFEARRERRRDLACSSTQSSSYMEEEVELEGTEALIADDGDDGDCEESFCSMSSPDSAANIITRRMSRQRTAEKELVHKAVQTDLASVPSPSVPLRTERIPGSGVFSNVEPRYLDAMSILMSENLSASESVKAVYIVDTIIWKQIRHLPLRLEKHYMNTFNLLKKFEKQKAVNASNTFGECESVSDQTLSSESEAVEAITSVEVDEDQEQQPSTIRNLKKIVNEFVEVRKNDMGNTLPDPHCVRHNHNLIAVYCEGKVADEIMEKQGFILPDGTSRRGIGEIAGCVVKTGDRIRAFKALKIGKADRENWAKAIYQMLDRLATASHKDIVTIWQNIVAMVTDLCKVNHELALEVKKLVGTDWLPGQAFCNLHFTLAIPEGIKNVLSSYQCLIGAGKLFPKNVSFEMNIEDKLIVIQILDCWMRLTSIRWQAQSWNRYSAFTEYAERRGVKNVGHMIHANRFGEFEERCAGGVYLVDVWISWLRTFADVRNQLACFLRSVTNVMDMCKFLWAGAALIGIHITSPFMSMLLEHNVTPLRLEILPKMYADLKTYLVQLTQFDKCGVPSLQEFFLDPLQKETTCYGVDVCKNLKEYVESCDVDMMNRYLKQICTELSIVLKRQRGNQYGFGDDPNSPLDVRKNMPEAMLNDSEATHTKKMENYFGNLDRELKKSGPQGFDKSTSDLVIKYSKDLIGNEHQWQTKENRNAAKSIKVKQTQFDNVQKQLIKNGVDEVDANNICSENKVLKCITQCKTLHNGPFVDVNKLHNLVQNKSIAEKDLHKSLNLEIRFRKLTLTEVKSTCPLFKQRGLTIDEKVKNLESLINSQLQFRALADMNDLEAAIAVTDEKRETENESQTETDETTHRKRKGKQRQPNKTKSSETGAGNIPDIVVSDDIEDETADQTEDEVNTDFKDDDFILALFEDGAYPGVVKSITEENVNIDIMRPVVIKGQSNFALWKWDSAPENQTIRCTIRPALDISYQLSTSRNVVFELLNYDLVKTLLPK